MHICNIGCRQVSSKISQLAISVLLPSLLGCGLQACFSWSPAGFGIFIGLSAIRLGIVGRTLCAVVRSGILQLALGELEFIGKLDRDLIDCGPCTLDSGEPLAECHGFFAENVTVFHGCGAILTHLTAGFEQEVLFEAGRWLSKLVEFRFDLQALQLVLIVDL